MIVHLGGGSLAEARLTAHRFLEATAPHVRRVTISKRQARIERRRMADKVILTRKLRAEIEKALRQMTDRFKAALAMHGIHEDEGAADYDDLRDRIRIAFETLSGHDLEVAISAIVAEALSSGVTDAISELGIETTFHVAQTQALRALSDQTLKFVLDIVDREKAAIKAELEDGISLGLGIPQISKNILSSLDNEVHYVDDDGKVSRTIPSDAWAEMVARTEVARAQNQGILATYAAAGVERITWVASSDACDYCAELDGETIDLGDDFDGGVDAPPLHPNCRCTTVSATVEDEAELAAAA